jgi:hypothetical protein
MAEPADMIVPLLPEMRAENLSEHEKTRAMIALLDKRLGSVESAQASYRQALSADTLMSKLATGEFQERIELLEKKMREFEGRS